VLGEKWPNELPESGLLLLGKPNYRSLDLLVHPEQFPEHFSVVNVRICVHVEYIIAVMESSLVPEKYNTLSTSLKNKNNTFQI